MQKTRVGSLNQEDSLGKEMATHSSILANGKSHRQRRLASYSLLGHKESDTTQQLNNKKHQGKLVEGYMGNLYDFCNFSVNLKVLQNKKFLKLGVYPQKSFKRTQPKCELWVSMNGMDDFDRVAGRQENLSVVDHKLLL